MNVDVNAKGAIILGPDVTCDGFVRSNAIRVQSHAHEDHTYKIDQSLAGQQVVCHPTTRDLLTQSHPHLTRRLQGGALGHNFHALAYNTTIELSGSGGGVSIELLNAEHLIGAAQVIVNYADGFRVAYSGDFGFRASAPSNLNALVVDSRIPAIDQLFTQDQVAESLFDKVKEYLPEIDIHLFGHFGALQIALSSLYVHDALGDAIVLGDDRMMKTRKSFLKHNIRLPQILDHDARWEYAPDHPKVFLHNPSCGIPPGGLDGAVFYLNRMRMDAPITQIESMENAWKVAATCHSDIDSTIRYVEQTGASLVVVDNSSRSSQNAAHRLCGRLNQELNIVARLSSNRFSPD
jgi:putative mRNA 3-end processing factor